MQIFMQHFTTFLGILPTPPSGSLQTISRGAIEFFTTWISRTGGIVAFIGAVKLALSIKNEDAKEQMQSVIIMISGFMIVAAVGNLNLFSFGAGGAEAEFTAIMTFIATWVRRVGAIALFLGAIILGLAIKDKNAASKIVGLRTMAAGGMTTALSVALPQFVR